LIAKSNIHAQNCSYIYGENIKSIIYYELKSDQTVNSKRHWLLLISLNDEIKRKKFTDAKYFVIGLDSKGAKDIIYFLG